MRWVLVVSATLPVIGWAAFSIFNTMRSKRSRSRTTTAWRSSESIQDICLKYGLDPVGGFLPESCVERLPCEFQAWESIAERLPVLNRERRLKDEVDRMPILDPGRTALTVGEIRRAYIILGMLLHSYTNGGRVPWEKLEEGNGFDNGQAKASQSAASTADGAAESSNIVEIPEQLAIPFSKVCEELGLPTVLTAALDLWNWRRTDAGGHGSECQPEKLQTLTLMTGTDAERFFHMIPCAIQARIGPLIAPIMLCPQHILGPLTELRETGGGVAQVRELEGELLWLLKEIRVAVDDFKAIFSEVWGLVDPSTFYDVYRPLLSGTPPQGILLKGAGEGGGDKVVHCKGPSAGQSAFFYLIDDLLGVSHMGEAGAFKAEMLAEYIPREHRVVVQDFRSEVKRRATVRDYIAWWKPECSEAVRDEYDECLRALATFRGMHLGIASRYLASTSKGTGESSFKRMLDEALDATLCVSGLGSKSPTKSNSSAGSTPVKPSSAGSSPAMRSPKASVSTDQGKTRKKMSFPPKEYNF